MDFESQFPFLRRGVAWLDNAATTQKPWPVLEAMQAIYANGVATPRRGVHQLGNEATQAFEDARTCVAEMLGGTSANEVVFTKGTTESINMVARGWAEKVLRPGDRILVSAMEHHSNWIPWQQAAKNSGASLDVIPLTVDFRLDMEALEILLSSGRVRLVALAWVSNVLGAVNEVRRVVELAHAAGAKVLVDGAQGMAHFLPDVVEWGCDFFAFSGHKVFGPGGIGVLWGRRELLEETEPLLFGGEMVGKVEEQAVCSWAELPHRLEGGTPHVAGAVGLATALRWLRPIVPVTRAEELRLIGRVREELQKMEGVTVWQTEGTVAPLLSFTLKGIHPHDVAQVLDEEGVAVRAGHMCAQPLLARLGISAAVRVSMGPYNTEKDVQRLMDGLQKARRVFG